MATETCEQCGALMTEQPAAYEMIDLPGVPKPSDRFYEQWFICPSGHKKGYISGHSYVPALAKVISQTNVVCIRS
jgi:hypothetical protein